MVFTVEYRSKDGSLTEECIEAANRSECIVECKRRGIVPTSIREGGRSRSETRRRGIAPNRRTVLVAGGILLAAVLGGVWWWMAEPEAPRPSDVNPPNHVVASSRRPAGKLLPASKAVSPVSTNETAKEDIPLAPWDDSFMTNREMRVKYSTLFRATTNDGGVVVERYRLPNGKTWRRIVDPPPLFSNTSDQTIAMVMGGPVGGMIPPAPGLDSASLDKEFAKSLATPIRIEPDDPPRVAALKMIVKETRDEIARLKGAGDTRTVGQILSEHILVNNQNASIRAEAAAAIKRVRETDGEEAAKEYLDAVNKHLESSGVRPLGSGRAQRPSRK